MNTLNLKILSKLLLRTDYESKFKKYNSFLRRVNSLDSEVKASGFSKEIKEFDEIIEELEDHKEENRNEEQIEEIKIPNVIKTEEIGAFGSSHKNSFASTSDFNTTEEKIEEKYTDDLVDKFENEFYVSNKVCLNIYPYKNPIVFFK